MNVVPYTPATCFTIFSFFKQAPSFTPDSPYTPISLCFLAILPISPCLLLGLRGDRDLKGFRVCVSKLYTLSLGTIMRCEVRCKEKSRRGTEDGETREGGEEKGASMWDAARFSRWGYLICPVNLRCGMAVHCIQHACVCSDECPSASLAVDVKPACKGQ